MEQNYSLTSRQLQFSNGNNGIVVVVNTNISAREYVTDVLSVETIIQKSGRRDTYVRPKYNPVQEFNWKKTKQEKDLLKKLKSQFKKSNKNRVLTSVKVY